ncbi:MAG TPA: CHASE2 domain-containing protein, partial [Bacteroidota bacterium]
MKRSPQLLSVAIALPVAVLILAGSRLFAPLEDQLTRFRYGLRGTEHADTNIVLIYVDNEAVKTVGWPVRRNFHALLLHALAELHPRAVGMEIVFEDPRSGYAEFPEYDTLLAATMRQTGCAVLASYFDQIG